MIGSQRCPENHQQSRREAFGGAIRLAFESCIDEMGDLTESESRERSGCNHNHISSTASFVSHLSFCRSTSMQEWKAGQAGGSEIDNTQGSKSPYPVIDSVLYDPQAQKKTEVLHEKTFHI
jgi:hypothetical protein